MRTEKHTLFPESILGSVLDLRREEVPTAAVPAKFVGQRARAYSAAFAAGYRGWQPGQRLGFTEPADLLQEALTLGFRAGREALAKRIGRWFPKPAKNQPCNVQLPGADCAVKESGASDPWILKHLDAGWSTVFGPLPPRECQQHGAAYEAGFNAGYVGLENKQNRYKPGAARSAYARGYSDGNLVLAYESGFLSARVQMWPD
jgi:hypothetical protein